MQKPIIIKTIVHNTIALTYRHLQNDHSITSIHPQTIPNSLHVEPYEYQYFECSSYNISVERMAFLSGLFINTATILREYFI